MSESIHRLKRGAVIGLILLSGLFISACLDDINEQQSQAFSKAQSQLACSVQGQNRSVKSIMEFWYLYVDQMPDRDPNDFSSPREMLAALQVDPPDRFSFISERETTLNFTEEGRRIGIGVQLALMNAPDDYRVVDVFADAPADQADVRRGDRVLQINGRSVQELFNTGQLGSAMGPEEEGVLVELDMERADGEEQYSVSLEKVEFVVDPVVRLNFFDLSDDRRVAYFHFRNFIVPAADRFDDVFAELSEEAVDELIIDMRYNGGGRIAVAEQLASQIAGDAVQDEIFVQLVHNEARTDQNRIRRFGEEIGALGLDRLLVIATERTASASELVVNGLRPFIDVEIIGSRTFGKPVGSYGFEICDLIMFPTAFATLNALDEGDYFDGLPATCEAADDLALPLGDEEESSLAEALHFLETGQCDAEAGRLAREVQPLHRPQVGGPDGWDPIHTGIH
ncbi:S41 family peptidase [Gammaproteobacteria bacterium AB-CW1]|uniref:S41 family peptidase n=1 Tax=Natronospira elongata TaxID=3110268 RepID=A0AAP6JFU9_9GAMM|nr:S41 family peptidase [Gammaproteobacteria bacterium AB-CW1]